VDGKPLIEPTDLAAKLHASDCVVVDCRFELLAPHKGFRKYLDGHIPGARYAHLDKDLASPPRPESGRHPLPDPADFAACLGSFGIGEATHVVAYDDVGGAIAARLWWMLRWLGHREATVLDGGIAAWRRANLPLETLLPTWSGTRYPATPPRAQWVVETTELEQRLAAGALLLDARAKDRFRGEREPIDPVAGHIPGAVNLPTATAWTPSSGFCRATTFDACSPRAAPGAARRLRCADRA
jgi:thiosulfate/3-mercaptopyruvate sulfurtransferase